MWVVMKVNGRKYLKELTAVNICQMTWPELIEFESRVWTLAEKTKFSLRAIDVLNAIYREVEWRAQEEGLATHSRRRPRAMAARIS